MSKENALKQILIRVSEDYHTSIKRIAEKENKSMNQFLVDLIVKNIDSEDDSEDDQNDSELVKFLSDELEEKNSQIDKLHSLLNQQQQLSLITQKEKEKLLLEIDHIEENEENRPFWARWFK